MLPWTECVLNILSLIVIWIGSYWMGRLDEQKKWAHIWFEQWKSITDLDLRIKHMEAVQQKPRN